MKSRLIATLCLTVFAFCAKADPQAGGTYVNEKDAVLSIEALDGTGFDFTLTSQPDCPEGETTCLLLSGRAEVTAKGWTWAEGNSRIFFAATPEGLRILQTAGDLGSGTANRAAKLAFPGHYLPTEPEAEGDVAAEAATEFTAFRSPSGNIGCQFIQAEDTSVRCDLADFVPSFPDQPQDCEFDWGGAFWLSDWADTGEVVCSSDTVIDPAAPVLDYGASLTVGDLTCRSEKNGISCENAAGHGFTLSRRKQVVY